MKAWTILAAHIVASHIDGLTDRHHLTTDPACSKHEAPRPGSRLDRASRGVSCTPCMVLAAFGPRPCRRPPDGWFCMLAADHTGPCPAYPIDAPSRQNGSET